VSVLEQVTLSWQALRHTLPQLVRLPLWIWVLPLAALQLALVVLLWNAAHPVFSWFMAPLLVRLGGEDLLHYPRIFERMPGLLAQADLVIGAVLGPIVIGAAIPAFAARFRGEKVEAVRALGEGFRRAPALVLALLPLNALLFAATGPLGAMLGARGGMAARLAPLVVAVASLAVQAAFFYVAPRVVLERGSAWAALRAVPATWAPGFVPALLVSIGTVVLLLPLQAPGVTASLLVERGTPELAGVLTLLGRVAGWINMFILTGAATLLYLGVVRKREEPA